MTNSSSSSQTLIPATTLSTASLHHLIASCPIKLKSSNYLIWGTQMLQLIQAIKLTSFIKEGKAKSSTVVTVCGGLTIAEIVEVMNAWKENDVLLQCWISGTSIEESMYLIVECSSAKEMWDNIEETYLQSTKDKDFQRKQQLQNLKLGPRIIDEYLKEFKNNCGVLISIHKNVDDENKIINFAGRLDPKYKTFRTVMLGKAPYPTLNQFVNSMKGFDMREYEDDNQ